MASFPSNLAVQTQSHDRVTFQSRVNGVRSPNPRSSVLHSSLPIHLHPSIFVTIFRFLPYICHAPLSHIASFLSSLVCLYTLRLLCVSIFMSLSFLVLSPLSLSYAYTFHGLFFFHSLSLSFFILFAVCSPPVFQFCASGETATVSSRSYLNLVLK